MKKFFIGMVFITVFVVMAVCITGHTENTWDWNWHDDDRVWSEYDDSNFAENGVDEWLHIGDELIIHIHYNPDLSGGWYEYEVKDNNGRPWLRAVSENLDMKKLGRELDTLGSFTLAKIDLENEEEP